MSPSPSATDAKPTILVTGATGGQGGSVARHLLAHGGYRVRALTRDTGSQKAQALETAGAELVRGDLKDRASLRAALAGCYGVFGVTNYWEHFEAEREHGMNLINAVSGAEVEHFVLSTLPSARELSGGTLEVPHFEIKAELERYARCLGLPATFLHVAFYYENFLSFFPPRPLGDGSFGFGFPQGATPLAAVAVEDVGGVVTAIFERPGEVLGKVVGAVGDDRPAAAYAEELSRALGRTVRYQHVPREVFAALGFPGAEDLAAMFELNRTRILERRADLEQSRQLYPEIRTLGSWLEHNRERFAPLLAG